MNIEHSRVYAAILLLFMMGRIAKLLMFAPASRMSAADALAHPYFEGLHNIDDEPEAYV